jgi:cysteine-rich repeat protein
MEIRDTAVRDNLARSTGTGFGIGHAAASGGGIENIGTLTIRGVTVDANDALLIPTLPLDEGPSAVGGGMANGDTGFPFLGSPPASGSVTVLNSTITGNRAVAGGTFTAAGGGGVLSVGDMTVSNTTIDGNIVLGPPPVFFGGGPDVLVVKPSAVASSATLRNSIVTECGVSGSPTLVTDDYNIAASAACGFTGTDQVGVDPLLGALADNGGPTRTRALLAGSPALEAANPAAPGSGGGACEVDDQRGVTRPQSARCDVGAFEITACGDGAVTAPEQCDDGDTNGGDGCSAGCSIESCWSCTGAPSSCSPTTGVSCDDGNACTSGDLCDGSGMCVAGAPVCPLCGNGIINAGEACDDGNNDSGDGCGACLIEACHACSGEPSACAPDVGASCDDGDSCTAGETCSVSAACVGGSDVCPLDHYKCYAGKDLDTPPFTELESVFLNDQLSTFGYIEGVQVTKLKYVCTPVDKNGEGITNPTAHLSCYQIRANDLSSYDVRYEVSTQFQTSGFGVKRGKLLCLPSTKTVLP